MFARHLLSFWFQIFQWTGPLIAIKPERAVLRLHGAATLCRYWYLIMVSGGIKHRGSSNLSVRTFFFFFFLIYLLCYTLICTEAKDANMWCVRFAFYFTLLGRLLKLNSCCHYQLWACTRPPLIQLWKSHIRPLLPSLRCPMIGGRQVGLSLPRVCFKCQITCWNKVNCCIHISMRLVVAPISLWNTQNKCNRARRHL